MIRACDSFSISLGVVPELMSAWKPEMDPQAMVMNRNGNRLPAKAGPVPVWANCVTAGIWICGAVKTMPRARTPMVPTFMKVER